MRTPTGCCGNTSRRALISVDTALPTSTASLPNSTTDLGNDSGISNLLDYYRCNDRQNPPIPLRTARVEVHFALCRLFPRTQPCSSGTAIYAVCGWWQVPEYWALFPVGSDELKCFQREPEGWLAGFAGTDPWVRGGHAA